MQNMSATRSNTRSTNRKQSTKPTAAKSSSLPLVLQLAKRHPFFCLFAVWVSFLFFGWLAISGLTYTNPAPLEVVKPEVQAAPFQLSKPINTFGLVMLVASSCAIASFLVAKQLRPVKPAPRRVVKRQVPPQQTRHQSAQSSRPRPSIAQQARTIAQSTPRSNVTAPPAPVRPAVTVLPIEDDSPIEVGNFTLAEILDIRQRVQR